MPKYNLLIKIQNPRTNNNMLLLTITLITIIVLISIIKTSKRITNDKNNKTRE